eukprot:4308855-Pyramimonas_sp.AAC.1
MPEPLEHAHRCEPLLAAVEKTRNHSFAEAAEPFIAGKSSTANGRLRPEEFDCSADAMAHGCFRAPRIADARAQWRRR